MNDFIQNVLWFFITPAYTLDFVKYSYQVTFSLPGTSAAFSFLPLQVNANYRLCGEAGCSERMLLLCAVAIIGRGMLSFFAATSDVWMGLNKGPIQS